MNLHHNLTFMRTRDIAELCIKEEIDDYLALLEAQNADPLLIKKSHEIEAQVTKEIENIEFTFNLLCDKLTDIKNEFNDRYKVYTASLHLCDEYQFMDPKNLMRQVVDGSSTFDPIKYFMKHVLKQKFDLSNITAVITHDRVKYDSSTIWQEG